MLYLVVVTRSPAPPRGNSRLSPKIGPHVQPQPQTREQQLHYYSTTTELKSTASEQQVQAQPQHTSTRTLTRPPAPVPPPVVLNSPVDDEPATAVQAQAATAAEPVPTRLSQAVRVFLLDEQHPGPRLVILTLAGLAFWRVALALGQQHLHIGALDAVAFGTAVVVWWFQEHAMHGKLLHSKLDWMGKEIHEGHHAKPYHHISIDPAALMLAWLATVHVLLRAVLPLPIALSATLGYAGAGLFYEWSHFIVHTRVKFQKGSYWSNMKNHHVRHHQVDDRYWLGFSLPAIDTLFGTNPDIREVRQWHRRQQQEQQEQQSSD